MNELVFPQNQAIATILTFMPILLFLFIVIIVMVKLSKSNTALNSFMTDKEQQVALKREETKSTVANANAQAAIAKAAANNPGLLREMPQVPPPQQNDENTTPDDQHQSVSRLLVFISGVTSVALAACISSFYFYRYISGDKDTDLGNLSTVLYGLGLGVIPYGFSKIAAAVKKP